MEYILTETKSNFSLLLRLFPFPNYKQRYMYMYNTR